jgi:hypothetical protein
MSPMETLDRQFADALTRINLTESQVAKASDAHQQVRAVLERDPTLRSYDVDTILIGSYGRHVAIQPGHDVDVFVKLHEYDQDSESMHEAVRKPLEDRYGDRVDDSGAHAIAIDFGPDFSVDAVGATEDPSSGHWIIPGPDDTGRRTQWEQSDPERLHELTVDRNKAPKVGDQGAYVPIVKMVRQIRSHHLDEERPKGLYFEFLTYDAFQQGVAGTTFAEMLTATLQRNAAHLESGQIVLDPALERPYEKPPTASQLREAARIFRALADKAAAALLMDKCPAAVAWREIFGQNRNGWVFPLPPDCDASGRSIRSVASNPALGSDEARGYA